MKSKGHACSGKVLKKHLKDQYVDVSQSLQRRTFTSAEDMNRTQTTSSVLYSFNTDSVLVGKEMLQLQGQSSKFQIPEHAKDHVLRELAGEGMSVPCVGLVLWSLFLSTQFPKNQLPQ